MAVAFADRCRQTSTTKGTGPFVLQAPEPSWFALSSSYAVDAEIPVVLVGRTSAGAATGEVVVGRGHLNGDGALVVDSIERSSAGGGPVSFTADVVEIFASATAAALMAVIAAAVIAGVRQGVLTLTSDTIVASFAAQRTQVRTAAGAVTIDATGYAVDADLTVVVTNGTGSSIAVTAVGAWVWLTDQPTTLAAGERGVLSLLSTTTAEGGTFAAWAVQP